MKFQIKQARENAGYSQKELAEIIGVAPNTFHGYESGKHDPKSDLLIKIANACNVTIDFLLGYDAPQSHKIKKAPTYSVEAMALAKDFDNNMDKRGQETVRGIADIEVARYQASTAEKVDAATRQEQREQIDTSDDDVYSVPLYSLPMSAGTGEEAGQEYPEDFLLKKRPPRGTSYIAHVSGNSMEPTYYDGDLVFIYSTVDIQVGQVGAFFMDGSMWVKELGDGVLISHNPDYPPRPMTEDIRCQGLVLGVCDDSYFE